MLKLSRSLALAAIAALPFLSALPATASTGFNGPSYNGRSMNGLPCNGPTTTAETTCPQSGGFEVIGVELPVRQR